MHGLTTLHKLNREAVEAERILAKHRQPEQKPAQAEQKPDAQA